MSDQMHGAENGALCEAAVPDDEYGTQPCEAPAVTAARYNDDGDPDPDGPHLGPVCTRHIPTCPDCGHQHTPNGCTGEPTPSDLWAGVTPAACDCTTPIPPAKTSIDATEETER